MTTHTFQLSEYRDFDVTITDHQGACAVTDVTVRPSAQVYFRTADEPEWKAGRRRLDQGPWLTAVRELAEEALASAAATGTTHRLLAELAPNSTLRV